MIILLKLHILDNQDFVLSVSRKSTSHSKHSGCAKIVTRFYLNIFVTFKENIVARSFKPNLLGIYHLSVTIW